VSATAGTVAAGSGGVAAAAGSGGGAAEGDDFGLPGFPDLGDGSNTPPAGDPGTANAGMCKDLVCFDVFDCVLWHPDEAAVCNFTDCVDFVCK
jgi:hypothetical protein